jgi:hypothetical protein
MASTLDTLTLDEFLQKLGVDAITLLKINVEGHDLNAPRGSLGSLRSGRIDVVQFEYGHRWIYARCFLRDVFLLIRDLPYQLCRVCPDRLELLAYWHPELERYFDSNFVLVHERARGFFQVHEGVFDRSNTYA